MSRRQPPRKKEKGKRKKTSPRRAALFAFLLFTFAFVLEFHIQNFHRFQGFQKPKRLIVIKLRILCFDNQEKTVARREGEARRVENRMVRLRQFVQREHA